MSFLTGDAVGDATVLLPSCLSGLSVRFSATTCWLLATYRLEKSFAQTRLRRGGYRQVAGSLWLPHLEQVYVEVPVTTQAKIWVNQVDRQENKFPSPVTAPPYHA
jgi:hypothetical protein